MPLFESEPPKQRHARATAHQHAELKSPQCGPPLPFWLRPAAVGVPAARHHVQKVAAAHGKR